MFKRKVLTAVLAIICIAGMLSGCEKQPEETPREESGTEPATVIEADPQKAIDEIYQDIDMQEVVDLDDDIMTNTLHFDLWDINEYYGKYSSGRYGVADVYIIQPFGSDYDKVRENLEAIKLDRIEETENYDILGSNKIAQNAQIYQYGNYLIFLMLEDNEAAAEIIQKYIPSTAVD